MKLLITGGSGFIGTNLIRALEGDGDAAELLNLDRLPPPVTSHRAYWAQGDILDGQRLFDRFAAFQPDAVVHLAARTDTEGVSLDDYRDNTEGTRNVLEAVRRTPSVQRLVVTSTQFVHQYHGLPRDDEDFAPHTVYGESKAITERDTRQAGLACTWTIVRPTNVWGPWHKRYFHEFNRVLAQGRYLHPSNRRVMRSYGYVGNVVWQYRRILDLGPDRVNGRVLYLGDEPIDVRDWVNAFSVSQLGRPVRVVPAALVWGLALTGDALKVAGIRFPITRSRYKSLTTSNDAPMRPTFELLGSPPYTLEQGVEETVAWMRIHYPHLVRTHALPYRDGRGAGAAGAPWYNEVNRAGVGSKQGA